MTTKKQPNMKPINNQSGVIKMVVSIAIPFWITIRGVVGKNGPSSPHCAPAAMTRTNYGWNKENNCEMKNHQDLYLLNPFVPNEPFLYPLKTSENLKVREQMR